ncbi:MAG: VanZ family protein [Methylotenera sp.]
MRWIFGSVVLVVLVLALMPTVPHMPTTGWDKANHMLAFAVLAWLGCQAFPQRQTTVLLGLLVYGVLVEVLQSLTSYRFGDWHDLLADALGMLIFWLLSRLYGFKRA